MRVSSFTSLFNSFKHAFQHDAINPAFVRSFYYNVTAIPSPRCVRSSRQRTSQTRRPPALSCRDERHENSTRNTNKKQNATRYIHRLYILVSFSPSAQGTLPRPNARIPSPEKATGILPGTSRPSAETNRADKASRSPILS